MAEVRRRGPRRPRSVAIARLALLGLAVAWIVLPSTARAADDGSHTQPDSVAIAGQIPGESANLADDAARSLVSAKSQTQVDYIESGTSDARKTFVDGGTDYVISGIPFSSDQLSALKKSGRGVIAAPFQAVGMSFLGFVPPLAVYPTQCVLDDTCTNADRSYYGGPIRFTPGVLLDLFYDRKNIWLDQELLSNLQLDLNTQTVAAPLSPARPIVRSDSDAFNYYLDAYLARTEPEERRSFFAPVADPGAAAPPLSEVWPIFTTPSRQGMDNVVGQVREGLDPGSSGLAFGGAVAPVSVGSAAESLLLNAAKPEGTRIPLYTPQLRNASGSWVQANPASITAALAAAERDPAAGAFGATDPAAYPISWVNTLYAPASGLTADQANGIATLIRWQVGAGQQDAHAAAGGDGKLTPKMVAAALAAANEIVESNCESAKGSVYDTTDGGPFAPSGGLGITGTTMELCQGSASDGGGGGDDTAAGVDPGTYDPGVLGGDSSGYSDLTADGSTDASGNPLDASVDPAGTGSGGSGGSGTPTDTEPVSVTRRLPFPIPGLSLSPLDRAVTLAMGAGIFVALRTVYQRRRGLL